MRVLGKVLEAVGIAALAIGVVQGIFGNISFEYYTFIGGVAVFFTGRLIGKHFPRKRDDHVG